MERDTCQNRGLVTLRNLRQEQCLSGVGSVTSVGSSGRGLAPQMDSWEESWTSWGFMSFPLRVSGPREWWKLAVDPHLILGPWVQGR